MDKPNHLTISLLVAADENNIIGAGNKLPWVLPNDINYFKNQTWGFPVIMGRKTFESLGKPLIGRKNIVLTRNSHWKVNGVERVDSFDDALKKVSDYAVKETFVIGGAEIYKLSFQKAHRIYITRIHHHFEGDAQFPSIPHSEWELIWKQFCSTDEKNLYPHTFQIWQRK